MIFFQTIFIKTRNDRSATLALHKVDVVHVSLFMFHLYNAILAAQPVRSIGRDSALHLGVLHV